MILGPKRFFGIRRCDIVHDRSFPVLYEHKEHCCGCTACYAICPKQAISMVEDEEGFEYPYIDVRSCVRCYMCMKVCPIKSRREVQS